MDYLKLVPQLTHILPPSQAKNSDCFWLKVVVDLLFTKETPHSVIEMLLNIIQNTLLRVNTPFKTETGAEIAYITDEKIAYNIFVKELLLQANNSRSGQTPKIQIIFDLLLVIFGVGLNTVIDADGNAFVITAGRTEQITNFYTETETCQSFKTPLIRKLLEHRGAVVDQINSSITALIADLRTQSKYTTAQEGLKAVIETHCQDIEGKLLENQIAILLHLVQETTILSTFKSILSPWKKDIAIMFAKYVGNSAVAGVKSGFGSITSSVSNLASGVVKRLTRSSGGKRKHQTRKRYKRRKT
jgi:hypothetical protein